MRSAIAKALGKVKLSEAIGGILAIKYTGDGEPTQRGFNAPKLFAAKFTPAGGVAAPAPAPISALPDNTAARQACWSAFLKKTEGLTKGVRESAWKQMMAQRFPGGVATKDMLASDLTALAAWIEKSYSLEAKAPSEMDDNDIPFDDVPGA
jgi:hypothetical protein